MATPRVLLLGGHGKVSMFMTPLMLARSWHVTSIIRNPDHTAEIQAAAKDQPGKLDVLVRSLDDVKSEQQAQAILKETNPSWVIWAAGTSLHHLSLHSPSSRICSHCRSAGAGGKGGAERTFAVDRDAAIAFITAAARTPSVTKFLMVSYIGSRRARAPWWTEADWDATLAVNNGVLANYHKAKVEADECLAALTAQRGAGFQGICLRPGTLKDEPATGKVSLGKISARGVIPREKVAEVAVRLLEREDAGGWIDLLKGDEEIGAAVERVVEDKVDCIEGEDVEGMKQKYSL